VQIEQKKVGNGVGKRKTVKSQWSLVCVHWTDAFDGESGWTDIKKYKPKELSVMTVGWLVPDLLENYLSLVNSYMPDEVADPETSGMATHIPVGMVKKIYVLDQPSVKVAEQ
jgi:hypothetical protein